MLSAVARIASRPINAWVSLLIALVLPFVKMSWATAPAPPDPSPGKAELSCQAEPGRPGEPQHGQVRAADPGAIPWPEPMERSVG